jgi:hypothetical protein
VALKNEEGEDKKVKGKGKQVDEKKELEGH